MGAGLWLFPTSSADELRGQGINMTTQSKEKTESPSSCRGVYSQSRGSWWGGLGVFKGVFFPGSGFGSCLIWVDSFSNLGLLVTSQFEYVDQFKECFRGSR